MKKRWSHRGSQMEFVNACATLISLKSIVFNCHAPSMIQFIGVDRCILLTIVADVVLLLLFFPLSRSLHSYEYLTNRWKRENSKHTVRKKTKVKKKSVFYLRTDASDFNEPNPTRLRISIKLNTVSAHKICRQRYRAMGDTLLCCYCYVSFNVLCALFLFFFSVTHSVLWFACTPNQTEILVTI